MGAGGSKAELIVHMDQAFAYDGSTVTGSVVLRVPAGGPPLHVDAVKVKLTGVEKCQWSEHKGAGENRHTETYRSKHVLFKHKIPMCGPCTFSAGDHQFPISFTLPLGLPGSFHCSLASDKASASIEYKVKAEIHQAGLLKPDIKKTARINVLQRNKGARANGPVSASIEQPVSAWCCFNRGSIGMQVQAQSSSFVPGEVMHVRAQVDNRSTTQVPMLHVALVQRLTLTGKHWGGTRKKHLTSTPVSVRLPSASGGPGVVTSYEAALELAPSLEATCLGTVVSSTYELVVTAKTGCCLSEPALKHPILLNDPQPVAAGQPLVPPPDWQPQVYPACAFSLPPVGGAALPSAPAWPPAGGEAGLATAYVQQGGWGGAAQGVKCAGWETPAAVH